MSLRKAATRGVVWTLINQFGTQGISFLVSIVLARLLLPEEFGLIGMITVFIALGRVLVDSGLGQSLIRSKVKSNREFTSVFLFNILISLLVYGLFYLLAPLIGKFYNQPILTDIVRVYSLVFVINAIGLIQYTILVKNLNFKAELFISIPGLIGGAMVGISMALNGYGVWSLVGSALTEAIIRNILLWHNTAWRPSGGFSFSALWPHLSFGIKMGASGVLDTIFRNIYPIIIGKYFNPVQVGYFNRADTFKQLPVNNISSVLNKVSFPVFSKVADDDEKLRYGYRSLMHMVIFLLAPLMFFQMSLGEPLFRLLFSERWLPAVPYFQVLCLNGLLYPIHAYNLNVLKVKGRSDLFLRVEVYKKAILAVIVLVSVWFGMMALLWGSVIASVFSFLINTHFSSKFIDFKAIEQVKELMPYIITAALIAGIIYWMDGMVEHMSWANDIIRLSIGVLGGLSLYWLITSRLKLMALKEVKKLVSGL